MKDFIRIIFYFFIAPYLVIFGIKVAIEMLYDFWWLSASFAGVFVIAYAVGVYRSYKVSKREEQHQHFN